LKRCVRKFTAKVVKTIWLRWSVWANGYDDNQGAYFTELMAKNVDIGIVTKDGRLKRCNIHEYARNQKFKTEMGD